MEILPAQRKLFINGAWRAAEGGRTYEVLNPATGNVIAAVADATPSDATDAVAAAHSAFAAWSLMPGVERSTALRSVQKELESNLDFVAGVMTSEQGKPLEEARGELAGCVEMLEWYSEEAKRSYGSVLGGMTNAKRTFVVRQPVGVVATITPWNFPAMMIVRKLSAALAAGCTTVTKPAEQTPLTAIALFEIFERSGLPSGVVNLVTTNRPEETGTALTQDQRVRHITFTGSTPVGRAIAQGAGVRLQHTSMELGGQAPWIVFEDADMELAIAHLRVTKFRNSGQTCVSPNRIFVHNSLVEEFGARLAESTHTIALGPGLDPTNNMGPLIDDAAIEKVSRHVTQAVAAGARILVGGQKADRPGFFFQPTVLVDVIPDMEIMREETFGPVAPIRAFSTESEVIAEANGTPYGLIAYVYTKDISRAIRLSEALEFGIVGINDNRPGTVQTPFGGMKASGFGREGGREGLEAFLETKAISVTMY